jgi:glucose-6-phosphate 1-epimerase
VTEIDRLVRASLPPAVRVVTPADTLPRLDIDAGMADAQVFFHGAHPARWQPAGAPAPVLWLSPDSHFRNDKAIRGGVPICFPWFGPHPSERDAPAHGFARLRDWVLVEASESGDGSVHLALALDLTQRDSPLWPHACRVTFRIGIGATLQMVLDVENRDNVPFTFEEALHTYYAVADIETASITGLEDIDYLDKVEGFARTRQGREPIRFTGETDRVYVETTSTCRIIDPDWSRTIVVRKSGSRSTVVWNPGAERARSFPDFGADEWRRMVCVETANVRDAAVRLDPGATHSMSVDISIE